MNQKTTLMLTAAVLVAAVGVYFAQSSSKTVAPVDAGPKRLIEPRPASVVRLELAAGEKPALVFEKTGEQWNIVEPIKGPADKYKVNSEVDRLLDLEAVKSFAPGEADAPGDDLTRLSKPSIIAKLTDQTGKTYAFRIGDAVLMSNQTYVQMEGSDRVWVVRNDLNNMIKADAESFRDLRLAEFNANDAVRISFGGSPPARLVKADDKWSFESPFKSRADTSAVTEILGALSGARAVKFVPERLANLARFGLDKPRLSITVDVEKKTPRPPPATQSSQPAAPEFDVEKRAITLHFGASYDNNVYARVGDGEPAVICQLPQATFDRLTPDLVKLRDKRITTVDTMRATGLKLTGPAGAVDLRKVDGVWNIAEPAAAGLPGGGRAEFAAVDDALKAVRDLKATAFEESVAGMSPTYGFDNGTRIELSIEGEVEPTRLLIGAATPGGTGVYVRNERENVTAVVKSDAAAALTVPPLSFVERKLLTVARDRVDRIEIESDGVRRTLEKTGGLWRMTAPVQADSDAKVIADLLADLSSLDARTVVGLRDDLSKFGLDQPFVKCTVRVQPPPRPATAPASQAADSQPAAVASQPETPAEPPVMHTVLAARKDGKAYVFVEGGQTVAEIDDKIFRDLTAEVHSHKVVNLDTSKLTHLELKYPDRELRFEKRGADWMLEGEPGFRGDETKLRAVADALRDLTTDKYVSYGVSDLTSGSGGNELATYKLDAPAAAVTIKLEDGASTQLLISTDGPANDEARRRYAAVAGDGKVFLIAGGDADKFMKKITDLEKPS